MTVLYAWKNLEWDRWFYVGTGSEKRVSDTKNRSKHFVDVVSAFDCKPYVLLRFPEETDAKTIEFVEKNTKEILLSLGEPVYDAERDCLHREAQMKGITAAKAEGKYTGRKPIKIDEDAFTEQCRAWKNDETSPKFICKKLGISHATFYKRVKDYEEKHGIKREAE